MIILHIECDCSVEKFIFLFGQAKFSVDSFYKKYGKTFSKHSFSFSAKDEQKRILKKKEREKKMKVPQTMRLNFFAVNVLMFNAIFFSPLFCVVESVGKNLIEMTAQKKREQFVWINQLRRNAIAIIYRYFKCIWCCSCLNALIM